MSATVTHNDAAKPPKAAKTKAKDEGSDLGAHDKSLNLYQRIHAVMNDVRRLQKDKAVGSGNYAYKAVSEEKVVTELRTAMIRHGLVIFPFEQRHSLVDHVRPGRDGQSTLVSISTVDVRYKLVNVDKPEEFEVVVGSGTGVDPQDKGVGKAMTYALKYALLRTFMIPTGADPDDIHNEELSQQQEAIAPMQVVRDEPQQNTPVVYATIEQLEELKRLVEHPLISRQVKTAVLTKINNLTADQATRTIAKLLKTITDGEGPDLS